MSVAMGSAGGGGGAGTGGWTCGAAFGVWSLGVFDPQAATVVASPMTASEGSHARVLIWALPRGPPASATKRRQMPSTLLRSPPTHIHDWQRCALALPRQRVTARGWGQGFPIYDRRVTVLRPTEKVIRRNGSPESNWGTQE